MRRFIFHKHIRKASKQLFNLLKQITIFVMRIRTLSFEGFITFLVYHQNNKTLVEIELFYFRKSLCLYHYNF